VHARARPEVERRASSPEAILRRKLYRVLGWSEQQRGSGVATISSGGHRLGSLLLAHGRVCLALPASGPSPDEQPLEPALVELLDRSQAAGGLSAAALISGPAGLQRARAGLLALTSANLVSMLGAADEHELDASLRPASDNYEPGLTFSPAELCLASFAHVLPGAAGPSPEPAGECLLLVLARGREPEELPYPVAGRGLEGLGLRELFQLGRAAFELCALPSGAGLHVVGTSDERGVWQYARGSRRLVATCAPRNLAAAALSWAILVAAD
jgi:hypothetical protein